VLTALSTDRAVPAADQTHTGGAQCP
jgi:hypothetical protein